MSSKTRMMRKRRSKHIHNMERKMMAIRMNLTTLTINDYNILLSTKYFLI